MSLVNKYTESGTYSGGNLVFTYNDGLTYSVALGNISGNPTSSGVDYDTINIQAAQFNPAASTTRYIGLLALQPAGSGGQRKIYLRRSGTITAAELYARASTPGDGDAWPLYIRLNDTTDYIIATVSISSSERIWSNTSMNIPIVSGDYIEVKMDNPAWVNAPASVTFGGLITMESELQFAIGPTGPAGATGGAGATPSLSQVLAVDNNSGTYSIIMGTGTSIKAAYGGGQIDLNSGMITPPGEVMITNDNGGYSNEVLLLTNGYIELSSYNTGGEIDINGGDNGFRAIDGQRVSMKSGSNKHILIDNSGYLDVRIPFDGFGANGTIWIQDNKLSQIVTNTADKPGIFIGTKNSAIDADVKNSVVIGGDGMTASQDNTVYIQNLNINNRYTLPNVDGLSNQVLTTNGSGVVSWGTVSGGTDTNFATDNLTFTGNRTHNAATYNLNIEEIGHSRIKGVSGSPVRFIIDNDNATDPKILSWRTGNTQRWAIRVDGTGDDFAIRSYDDGGTYQWSPITIERASNEVSISSGTPSKIDVNAASVYIQNINGSQVSTLTSQGTGLTLTQTNSSNGQAAEIRMNSGRVWIFGSASYYKLPDTWGSNGQILTTDGAGETYWGTASSYTPSARITAWDAYNTNGLLVQTSTTTWTNRTITGTSPITVSNGDGISGNPTIGFNGAYTGTFTASAGLVTQGNITGEDLTQNYSSSAQTTNATQTTIKTISTTSEYVYMIEVNIVAGTTTTTSGYSCKMIATYKNNGGTVTQIGSTQKVEASDFTGTMASTLTISGTNILVRITGQAATTIDWGCSTVVRFMPMGVI